MDFFTLDKQRFANGKECIFKLTAFFSSLSAFVFEIVIANSQSWRLWGFDDNIVKFVSFGLWEAHYSQEFNVSGTITKMLVHTPIDSTWSISPEFLYAQNLMVGTILMNPIVLVCSAMAIKISYMKHPYVELQIYCYKVCALVLCVSGLFTFVSVSWNHMVDLYGQTTLDFPPDFPVKKEALINKYFTVVFPFGVLTATMSLFGVINYLSEISNLKLQSQLKAKCASKFTKQEV
ncbi:uncharacterized protein LOC101830309 [Mesocricetus auratus]|uniref:Uncharacterized protein LOC101830309 n=1 Tax=Mesocricetus auratus TaxID=10036 RepID=A0A1U7RI53_MESAU|nr:uncharacterized protein LOC101830309 [Mesocricetus auratus]